MTIRHIGYFREASDGDPRGPSIHASLGGLPADLASNAARYLRGGAVFVATSGRVDDCVRGTTGIALAVSRTDGEWCWPDSLAYYVDTYRVDLPDEFVTKMRNSSWQCPEVTRESLQEVCRQAMG
jgi:hypothetical protein